ncbi:MAG TPA: thioesterase family protein [Pyrinomonadaceae bacterium]|nr:thioesterase family protein [Pyrinomonadaceae bacterium]
MSEVFTKTVYVGWGDLDSNAHMKNTAYLDKAVDVRMMYFQEQGFSVREFERLRLGPVVMRDEVEYYRELRLLEQVQITLKLAGMSENATRFRMQNEFFREDGQMAARVTSTGGWLDLSSRKLVVPPAPLVAAMNNLAHSADYELLPSSLKGEKS